MNRRVCFVSLSVYGYFNSDADPGGGAQRQLYLLSQELKERFDIHFVVGDYGQPKTERRDGITLHRAYRPNESTGIRGKITDLYRLRGAMERAGADLYVFRGRPWKAVIVYLLTRSLRKRFVYNIANDSNLTREPAALSPLFRWLFKRMLDSADAIIAQTEKQGTLLQSEFDAASTRVPNGYPTVTETVPYDQREHFLWVGSFDEKQKRPHLYLNLAERLPKAKFLLIGPGGFDTAYNEQVRRRAQSLPNVDNLGRVDPKSIHEYFREAIALVNTSAYEGFPNTFLEAWRYRTPVLSYEIDPSRFAQSEIEGYAAGDFDSLIEQARAVFDLPQRRRALAEPAAEYFERNLTIETVATQYGNVLGSVCHQS